MENLTSNTVLNVILAASAIIVGIVYIFSSIRKQDIQVLRNSNEDLRSSIDDKTTEIQTLQTHLSIMEAQVGVLQQKVFSLEKQNGDLQTLVKEALLSYFQNNPKVAETLNEPSST